MTYQSLTPIKDTGITWRVTRDSAAGGLQNIIDTLSSHYNEFTSEDHYQFERPSLPAELQPRQKVKVTVKKEDQEGKYQYYGNVNITYAGTCKDTSTWENKTAQMFWVYFNMGQNSETERNHFLR